MYPFQKSFNHYSALSRLNFVLRRLWLSGKKSVETRALNFETDQLVLGGELENV